VITTLIDNGNGTFSYTSEDGTVTTFDAKDTNTTKFGQLGDSVYYVDGFGDTTKVFVNNDTVISTLVDDGNGLFTYTDEKGLTTTFDTKDTVLTYFGQLGDSTYYVDENGDSTKVFGKKETLTKMILSNDTLIYTDEDSVETKLYLQDLDSTNEKIDTMYIKGDSLVLVEGGDTLYAHYGDGDWRESNARGLEGIPGGSSASGVYSLAAGSNNTAIGYASLTFGGNSNSATGFASSNIGGSNNSISGSQSSNLGGFSNNVSGFQSTNIGGENNVVLGDNATVIGGESNTAFSYGETVLGLFSTTYTPATTMSYTNTDKLLVVGNGTSTGARSNAFTLLKDGRLGLGVDGSLAQTATLHIKPQTSIDPLRVEGISLAQTNDTSILVVNPADGTVRYMNLDSVGTIDSISNLRIDTLSVHQGNSVNKVALANTMAEIYDVTGGNILLDIFANLPFGTAGIVDANYTITANSITVTKTGRYKITCRVSVEMTDGNNRSESEYQLTNNNVVIPGTYAAASHRNRNINITTITVIKVVDLYAGETIRVEGRKALGSGSLQTHANGSSLLIERL
jgi:hypothetical protein